MPKYSIQVSTESYEDYFYNTESCDKTTIVISDFQENDGQDATACGYI